MSQPIIIGSHVKVNKQNQYLKGAFYETINNGGNAMMIYTGPPQNTIRTPIEEFKIEEFQQLLAEAKIPLERVIVHSPYLINLGNTIKPSVFHLGQRLLKREIERAAAIGCEILVLHPGSAVGADPNKALHQIAEGLNAVLKPDQKVKIALETMAGKGSDVGTSFEQLKMILDELKHPELVGICWDTCHLYDAGYDIKNKLDQVIEKFDQIIGLDKLLVMHINDSKMPMYGAKDRHANVGYGYLGFDALMRIIYHPRFQTITKILETPYVNKKSPYQAEIRMIKNKKFDDPFGGELTPLQ